MATTVTQKGQVTLPKHVRDAAGIKPGDTVEVRRPPRGRHHRKGGCADGLRGQTARFDGAAAHSRSHDGRNHGDEPRRERRASCAQDVTFVVLFRLQPHRCERDQPYWRRGGALLPATDSRQNEGYGQKLERAAQCKGSSRDAPLTRSLRSRVCARKATALPKGFEGNPAF